MLEIKNVKKAFNQNKHNEFWAVRGVTLSLKPNKITVLKGHSGSGKTTLLSMVGCLSRPTSGRITLNDKILSSLPERFMTEIRRDKFGFIFQQFNLIKGLTALENIMLPAYPLGKNHQELVERSTLLLEQFNLPNKGSNKVEWLSGGEAQRTAICRALINNPEFLLADEPTANLDSKLSLEFMSIINDLKSEGKTILLTSHDSNVFDSPFVDEVIEMNDGLLK
jgi:putative ABC transport system ATP-binding protein